MSTIATLTPETVEALRNAAQAGQDAINHDRQCKKPAMPLCWYWFTETVTFRTATNAKIWFMPTCFVIQPFDGGVPMAPQVPTASTIWFALHRYGMNGIG